MSGFRHVVMFTWLEGTTSGQKQAVVENLATLPALIPEIKAYSLGEDAGVNPGNYEFVVVGDFTDRQAYITYRDHPAHRAVIDEYITPIIDKRCAVQYELS